MPTMYETIMNLPLFKGVSHDQVSSFLEKTHIKFSKYNPGEIIAERNDPVKTIKCIISGFTSIKYLITNDGRLSLQETISGEHIIGADRLFGMDTTYNSEICAINRVSIMEFNKDQYLNLLTTSPIYLLNYLNYLSYQAQKIKSITAFYPYGSLGNFFKYLLEIYTSRRATELRFEFDIPTLCTFTNISHDRIESELAELVSAGAIEKLSTGIRILDKELL